MRLYEFVAPIKPFLVRIRCDNTIVQTAIYGGSEVEVRKIVSELFGKNSLLGITTTTVQVLDDVGDNQHKNEIDVELPGGDGLVKKMALAQLNDGKSFGASKNKQVMARRPMTPEQLRVKSLQDKVDVARARGDVVATKRARNDVQVEKKRQSLQRAKDAFQVAASKASRD